MAQPSPPTHRQRTRMRRTMVMARRGTGKMSQSELARRVGKTQSFINQVERGKRGCSTELWLAIAEHLRPGMRKARLGLEDLMVGKRLEWDDDD